MEILIYCSLSLTFGFVAGYLFDFTLKTRQVKSNFLRLARELEIEEKSTMFRELSQGFAEDIQEYKTQQTQLTSLVAKSVRQNDQVITQITSREEKTIVHLSKLAEGLQEWTGELDIIMDRLDRVSGKIDRKIK